MLHSLINSQELVALVQANAFSVLVGALVIYAIWHSACCTHLKKQVTWYPQQNPVRVASLEQKRKEVRLQQAIQFEQELEAKRQLHKVTGGAKNATTTSTRRRPKPKVSYTSRSYNPLTGTGAGGFSSFKPQSRMKRSGGG